MISFDICKGNPGALAFFCDAYGISISDMKVKSDTVSMKKAFIAESAFERMQSYNITGSKLYVLWNDCCHRDTNKALNIMLNEDIKVILEHIDDSNGLGKPFDD